MRSTEGDLIRLLGVLATGMLVSVQVLKIYRATADPVGPEWLYLAGVGVCAVLPAVLFTAWVCVGRDAYARRRASR